MGYGCVREIGTLHDFFFVLDALVDPILLSLWTFWISLTGSTIKAVKQFENVGDASGIFWTHLERRRVKGTLMRYNFQKIQVDLNNLKRLKAASVFHEIQGRQRKHFDAKSLLFQQIWQCAFGECVCEKQSMQNNQPEYISCIEHWGKRARCCMYCPMK